MKSGSKVLDAPCGYGRIALAMAERGAEVLGLDQSASLLQEANSRLQRHEATAASDASMRLQYRQHDLRNPIEETDFDVALNIFSSLGYGSEEDDVSILATLRKAVKPGGLVFVESIHRACIEANVGDGPRPSERMEDGTLLEEEPHFCPNSGRVETTWKWSGPKGSGEKSASIRIYSITEFESLIAAAGLRLLAQRPS